MVVGTPGLMSVRRGGVQAAPRVPPGCPPVAVPPVPTSAPPDPPVTPVAPPVTPVTPPVAPSALSPPEPPAPSPMLPLLPKSLPQPASNRITGSMFRGVFIGFVVLLHRTPARAVPPVAALWARVRLELRGTTRRAHTRELTAGLANVVLVARQARERALPGVATRGGVCRRDRANLPAGVAVVWI